MAAAFFAAVTIPRMAPVFLVLSGCVALVALLTGEGDRLRLMVRSPVVIALFALTGYLFINSTWALDPGAALEKSGIIALLAAATVAAAAHIFLAGESQLRRAARLASVAFLAGTFILLIEYLFDQPIWKFAYNSFPALTGDPTKHVIEQGGKIIAAERYILNRNAAMAAMLFWPALLLAGTFSGRARMIVAAGLIGLVSVCILLSISETSKVALVIGALTFAAARVSLRTVRFGVTGAWVAVMLFAVPLSAAPQQLGWTDWKWLPDTSVTARFHIWSYTADKVRERPLTGIGIRGTRELQKVDGLKAEHANPDRYRPRPGRHAHNAFLQIWLELGAIGAGFVLALGIAMLRQIARLGRREAAAGYALFSTVCTVAAFGFGIWQTWLLAGFALSGLGLVVAVRLAPPRPGEGG